MANNKKKIDSITADILAATGESPTVAQVDGKTWTATSNATTATAATKQDALTALLLEVAKDTADFESGDMTEAEAAKCVSECLNSKRDYCECKCNGANHGAGATGLRAVFGRMPTLLGPKPCGCGCGAVTTRRFVAGHDARFHAREKRESAAKALGITVEEYAEKQAKARQIAINEKAKARRADRKATVEAAKLTVVPPAETDAPVALAAS